MPARPRAREHQMNAMEEPANLVALTDGSELDEMPVFTFFTPDGNILSLTTAGKTCIRNGCSR